MFVLVLLCTGAWGLGLWMDDHLHGVGHVVGIAIGDIGVLAGIGAVAFWIRATRAHRRLP